MFRILAASALVASLSIVTTATSADAGSRYRDGARISNDRVYVPTRRSGPRVKGFRRSVGGYSYTYNDAIISGRDDYLSLDPVFENDQAGPFDSGFFYDSNVGAPNRSEAPYP